MLAYWARQSKGEYSQWHGAICSVSSPFMSAFLVAAGVMLTVLTQHLLCRVYSGLAYFDPNLVGREWLSFGRSSQRFRGISWDSEKKLAVAFALDIIISRVTSTRHELPKLVSRLRRVFSKSNDRCTCSSICTFKIENKTTFTLEITVSIILSIKHECPKLVISWWIVSCMSDDRYTIHTRFSLPT